jgi:hypothetical protein
MAAPLRLSVVVPVGPGDRSWPGLLGDLGALGDGAEVILVATEGEAPADFVARDHGLAAPARWLEAPAGRARQQNAGARAAAGESLWFLHADSRLPARSVRAAEEFAGRNGLGYFRLRYLADGPLPARLNAVGAGIRSRLLGLPFGDQGFLLPRATFRALGCFDESLDGGEDHALVWMARARGVPLVPIGDPIFSSARRYRDQGWLRTTLRHARLTISQARRFSAAARRRSSRS